LMVLLYDRTFVAGSYMAALRCRARYYVALASSWVLLACLVIGLLVAAIFGVAHLSKEQPRLVLAPATCIALVPLGLTLPSVPGGCLYTGPVHRDFHSIGLGDIWVARNAVLAEAPPLEGAQP